MTECCKASGDKIKIYLKINGLWYISKPLNHTQNSQKPSGVVVFTFCGVMIL